MTTDQPVPVPFPAKGIDVSRGYGKQPPGSTPVAKNVRLVEATTLRMRGGSRPGLVKYIAQALPLA